MASQKTQTAFIINDMSNTGTYFQMQVTIYYNYDNVSEEFINSQTFYHSVPLVEFYIQNILDSSTNATSCELNGKNKCIFRYTTDMIELTGSYNNPSALYQYIAQNLI